MSDRNVHFSPFELFAMILVAAGICCAAAQSPPRPTSQAEASHNWQAPARWRHGLRSKTSGSLLITDSGVEFRPSKGEALRWRFEEIQTFDLTPHRLRLTGYQNRRWHFHGERSFRFDLEPSCRPRWQRNLPPAWENPRRTARPIPARRPLPHSALAIGRIGAVRTARCVSSIRELITSLIPAAEREAGAGPTSKPWPVRTPLISASAATARLSNSNSKSRCPTNSLTGSGMTFTPAT